MQIRCHHCNRIDGRLWFGPFPCCELPPFEPEVRHMDDADRMWMCPTKITAWTSGGLWPRPSMRDY